MAEVGARGDADADPHFALHNYGLLASYRPHSHLIYNRSTTIYRPTTTTSTHLSHPYAVASSYYGHHHHHIGKRSADAAPDADADAAPEADPHFYNYLNYGYNLGGSYALPNYGYSSYNGYRPYLYGGYYGHYYG